MRIRKSMLVLALVFALLPVSSALAASDFTGTAAMMNIGMEHGRLEWEALI